MAIRMPHNISLRRNEMGRGKEPIYDEILGDFFDTKAAWKREELEGLPFMVVPKKMLTKEPETVRVMLNERLDKWDPAKDGWGPGGEKRSLRFEVKVRARLLTQKTLDEEKVAMKKKGLPEGTTDFEGYLVGEKYVLIEERDQVKEPYTDAEKGIAKNQGKKVNAPEE